MNALEAIGSGVIQGLTYVGGLTMQFWSGLRASPRVLPVLGKRTRWQTAMRQMAAIGVDALPIVAIMSVCAGFILAMQTGTYLKRYGALQYVMDVVAIGFTGLSHFRKNNRAQLSPKTIGKRKRVPTFSFTPPRTPA